MEEPRKQPQACKERTYLMQGRGRGERPLEGVHDDGHLYLWGVKGGGGV